MKKLTFLALFFVAHSSFAGSTLLDTDRDWLGTPLPSGKRVVITQHIIPPLSSNTLHIHEQDACGYLARGRLLISTADGHEKIIQEGDAICEVTNRLHFGTNLSDLPAVIILFDKN